MNITVENIKCSGCAAMISKKLNEKFNTDSTEVDVEQGVVSINISNAKSDEVADALLNLGYPKINSVNGLASAKAKAKSFVSCAIGKIDK